MVVFIYMFVTPFIETPYWCIESKKRGETDGLTYDCQVVSKNYVAKYSEIANLSPIMMSVLDILCLIFFAYFRWFKSTWAVQKSRDKMRNVIFIILYSISIAIFVLSAFEITSMFLADMLRPFVIINFFRTLRFNLKEFYHDLRASFTILVTVFAWIFYFTVFGFYLFRYTFEGSTHFLDLGMSYSNLFTALTTANFPDVGLPAYQRNYFTMLFFISFLLVGLYLLLNILLASVFSKFTLRLEARITKNRMKRRNQVLKAYKRFERNVEDHLDAEEFRGFLAFIYDLKIDEPEGRSHYRRILGKMGVQSEEDDVPKDTIVNFMVARGALELRNNGR